MSRATLKVSSLSPHTAGLKELNANAGQVPVNALRPEAERPSTASRLEVQRAGSIGV